MSSRRTRNGETSPNMREQESENAAHFYHIGDVATLTGLSADALRAWERVGLLTPHRSTSGVRRYIDDDLARIRLIARTLQEGGYSRRAVAQLLQSGDLRPDAADYAPGPARLRRSRRGGNWRRASRRSDTGVARGIADGESGNSKDDLVQDQEEQDEARSERRTLDAVARISDALASGRILSEVLEVICSEACRAFGVSDSVVWLLNSPPILPVIPSDTRSETERKTGAQQTYQAGVAPLNLVAAASYGPHTSEMPRAVSLVDRQAPVVQAFHTRHGLIVNEPATPSPGHSRAGPPRMGCGYAERGAVGRPAPRLQWHSDRCTLTQRGA